MILGKFLIPLLLIISSLTSSGQKLQSGEYTVIVKKFVQGEAAAVCGPKNLAYGATIKVKSKDELKGIYFITLVYLDKKQSMFTVKNSKMNLVNPMLVYNKENFSLQYISNKIVKDEIKLDTNKTMAEQMLSGMILWLNVKKETLNKN
jgi:hypothetical protein